MTKFQKCVLLALLALIQHAMSGHRGALALYEAEQAIKDLIEYCALTRREDA